MPIGHDDPPPASRRARLRAQALAEIREHGYAQIAAGGPAALSLNGIARSMGMSGAAMYRYFGSRDELLTTLVIESYAALADAVHAAYERGPRRSAANRLRATGEAFREWALAAPHRYRLLFESSYGSGAIAPEQVLPSARRLMDVILDAFLALPDLDPPAVRRTTLRRELERWGQTTAHPDAPAGLFLLGQLAWSRMHGIISLEIEGNHEQMGVAAAELYALELDRLLALATSRRPDEHLVV